MLNLLLAGSIALNVVACYNWRKYYSLLHFTLEKFSKVVIALHLNKPTDEILKGFVTVEEVFSEEMEGEEETATEQPRSEEHGVIQQATDNGGSEEK